MDHLPGPALKAILERAGPAAAASLRAASRGAAADAADALHAVSLTLTSASTRADVDAWLRATRRLAHAPKLTVAVVGAVPFGAIDALFARLASRGMPSEVVLRGGSGSGDGGESLSPSSTAAKLDKWHNNNSSSSGSSTAACGGSVPAACLARLAGVRRLTLHGVALRPNDETAGSAAADLVAHANNLLAPLAAGARCLTALELGPGWAAVAGGGGRALSLDGAADALAALAALPGLTELGCALPPPAITRPPAALAGLVGAAGDAAAEARASLERLVAALLPLRGLRALRLSGLPDVWGSRPPVESGPFATSEQAGDEEEPEQPQQPRVPAALEGLGAMFSAAMPHLRQLDAALVGGWAMHWAGDGAGPVSLRGTDAVVHLGAAAAAARPRLNSSRPGGSGETESTAANDDGGDTGAVANGILAALAPYVVLPRDDAPRAVAPALVRSLHLSVTTAHVPNLEAALAALPGLRRLRVTVLATSAQGPAPLGALVAAVARGAPAGLEALALCPGLGPADVGAATFAPLAAGAAARTLAALKLVGALRVAEGGATAAEAAWAPLASLAKLKALAVTNITPARAPLPEHALPEGLVDLELRGVTLLPVVAGATSTATTTIAPLEGLRSVMLVNCDAGDVAASRLAGARVAEAVISGTRLGGAGWRGVAAAWPALASLAVLPPADGGSSAADADNNTALAAGAEDLLGALPLMRRLEALALHRLPALDDAALAALAAAPALRRLAVTAAGCALTHESVVVGAGAAGEAGSSSTSSSSSGALPRVPARIKALSLQLPACQLPPHLVAVLNSGSDSGAGHGTTPPLPWWSLPASSDGEAPGEWAGPGGLLRKALAAAFPGASARVALNQVAFA